jgi:hypothetical protein
MRYVDIELVAKPAVRRAVPTPYSELLSINVAMMPTATIGCIFVDVLSNVPHDS